jgi:rsbT co-antagonist protein RsbR
MKASTANNALSSALTRYHDEILVDWMQRQKAAITARSDLMSDAELRSESQELLGTLRRAVESGNPESMQGTHWDAVRELLGRISRSRANQGFSPTETATFVFSLKEPLFLRLRKELDKSPESLANELWTTTVLLDRLGLYTTEIFQESREEIIARQQRELLELSTPVVQLWQGIVALPLIGTLDSERTQVVMENLLQKIVDTGAPLAIIDITGVPTVDTLVAQHLLKTVAAARLMGADCIISGIRPQIAQTIVHLGVDLTNVVTKATLADAFAIALSRVGLAVTPRAAQPDGAAAKTA